MTDGEDSYLREWISEHSETALLADGFIDAVIGVGYRCGQPPIVVYDAGKCVEILMSRDGMEYDEALEFFEFNTVGSWVGPETPIYVWTPPQITAFADDVD